MKLVANESSYIYNDKWPAGVICDQKPGVGESVPPGTEVFVYISLGEQTDAMPKLTGYSAENAASLLKALHIQLTILTEKEYSDDIPEGRVVRTDPEDGTELKNGQVVTVYISMGKEVKTQKVPDVTGSSLSNANSAITGRNLEITVKEEYSSTVSEGYVISQSPNAGTELEEGSTVTVVVSKGKQTVTVPSVVGYGDTEAIEKLDALDLNAKSETEYDESVPVGMVIRQSPEANTEVMPDSTVILTVSLGPTPPPPTQPPASSEAEEPSNEPTEASQEQSNP